MTPSLPLILGCCFFIAPCFAGAEDSGSSSSKEAPLIPMQQVVCGALARDDFNSGKLDPRIWRTVISNPDGIQVEVDQGELCFRGTLDPVPKGQLPSKFYQTTHVDTPPSRETDVCAAVRMKIPSGIAETPGYHAVKAHLCGLHPDTYAEVLLGRVDGPETGRLMKKYWGANKEISRKYPGAINIPPPDSEGWWFEVNNCDPMGASEVVGKPLALRGDERERFYEVLLTYDKPTGLASAQIKLDEGWTQIGHSEPIIHNLSWVELKYYNITETHGTYHEARFDDCRLYLNPKRHPVRFIATMEGAPYRTEPLRFVLLTHDGKTKIGEGLADETGLADVSVDSPEWFVFPQAALVHIYEGEKLIARSRIESNGVDGLYPHDVWVVHFDLP